MRIIHTSIIILFLFFLQSCSDEQQQAFSKLKGQLGTLYDLQSLIEEQIEEGEVGVRIQNGEALTVSLVNTRFNEMEQIQREEKANALTIDIKNFIKQHEDLSDLTFLFITFVEHDNYLIANFTKTLDYYRFELNDSEQANSDDQTRCVYLFTATETQLTPGFIDYYCGGIG
ncbi:MAG: hypothetical protein PVF28_02880 [Thioalkalispiraceae bacterium]|jgi:hypothetical protein